MIAYDLQCENGHTFEGWFEDSAAYESQKKKKLIACPVCNNTEITKLLSTFAIKSASSATMKPLPPAAAQAPDGVDMAVLHEQMSEFVENNFDNVGCEFAKEALKIHYGVSEPRNIRGVSTKEEEKTLKEEGVEFFKFPMPVPPEPEQDTDS